MVFKDMFLLPVTCILFSFANTLELNSTKTIKNKNPNKITVFAQNAFGTVNNWVDARLAFYSIGESLDLALLDTRVTNLINAYAAAIP